MKSILLFLLITPAFSKGQSPDSFKKELSSTNENYYLQDSVAVRNGRDEKVLVRFNATIPVGAWNMHSKASGLSEREFFTKVCDNISIEAREALKNPSSFEPLTRQFIKWSIVEFTCSYRCIAKNGYGNASETIVDVTYVPNVNPLEQPLPPRRTNN